eukprot:GCRY01006581.1.p1 GENE.GCRY01006581.1~~GCRY01006581.1.p1  ORF type:complete len:100 (+),score=18.35 GCRY01006581.1:2020-2319(+)
MEYLFDIIFSLPHPLISLCLSLLSLPLLSSSFHLSHNLYLSLLLPSLSLFYFPYLFVSSLFYSLTFSFVFFCFLPPSLPLPLCWSLYFFFCATQRRDVL